MVFTEFVEQGDFNAIYRVPTGSLLDVDGGVLVTEVLTGTPAALAGIKPGDVIVRVDQIAVRSIEGLQLALSRAGSGIPLTLMRRGVTRTVLLREVGGR